MSVSARWQRRRASLWLSLPVKPAAPVRLDVRAKLQAAGRIDRSSHSISRDQGNRRNQLTFMRRQAELIAGAQGVKLPKEFIAAAAAGGLRQGALQQYLKLQV